MESRLIKHLGGTEELEKKAPQVLKLLQGAVSRPAVKGHYIQYHDTSEGLEKGSVYADDTFRIYLNVDEIFSGTDGIHSMLRTDFHREQKILAIVTDIYDADSNRLIDTRSEYFENTIYQEYKILSNSTLAKQCAKNKIRVESSFTWSTDGETAQEQTVTFEVDEFMEGQSIISSVQAEAPRAKNGKLTKVLYDRKSYVTEETDYHYENVMQPDGTAKLMMPFKGKVTVADDLEIKGIQTEIAGEEPKLCILLEKRDGAEYSNEKSFADQCVISEDKKSISWDIDDNWNTKLNLSHFYASTIVDLSCTFTLKVVNPKYPGVVFHPTVMINSVESPQPPVEGSGALEIERIQIIWGCVAKDTMILMADGTQKKISDIKIGEQVSTETEPSSVVNIYKGMESELVHLETENGHILRMTNSHPVKTTRGFVKASGLTAADTIITVEGKSKVKYLYMEQYDSEVYNLELKPEGVIICNGIIAGDFKMQNEMVEKPYTVSQPTSLQREFRSLFGH